MKPCMKEVEGGRKIKKSEERGEPWIIINAQGNKSECGAVLAADLTILESPGKA